MSVVPAPLPSADRPNNVRSVFFVMEVTTERLDRMTELFNSGKLTTRAGTVLPLEQVRTAHEMLARAPHQPGKIVLKVANAW